MSIQQSYIVIAGFLLEDSTMIKKVLSDKGDNSPYETFVEPFVDYSSFFPENIDYDKFYCVVDGMENEYVIWGKILAFSGDDKGLSPTECSIKNKEKKKIREYIKEIGLFDFLNLTDKELIVSVYALIHYS